MKKRLTALFLAFALVFALLPAAVLTASAGTYSGKCGYNLTWTLDTETGALEITGTGAMKDYDQWNDIPWYAYRNAIKTVSIGDGVESIGNEAFSQCTELTNISIGNSVLSIGSYVFHGCSALASIIIPSSIISIHRYAFHYCPKLSNISVDAGNAVYSGVEGALYNKDVTELICCPAGKSDTFSIPNTVTNIGEFAFYRCSGLTGVEIPDSVTNIGYEAFGSCEGLTSIIIPNSVTTVGERALANCTGLTKIAFSERMTGIPLAMFWNCSALCNIEIPDGITSIGDFAFAYCTSLKTITIPNSVKIIDDMFIFNSDVTEIYYSGTEEEWDEIVIQDSYGLLKWVKIHYIDNDAETDFIDVLENAWYYEAVNYAVAHGLMNGVGGGKFAPDDPMTRAMLVTVLWRYEGSLKEGTNTFSDVPAGQWYTDAVAWAAYNGIVGGVGNGKFDPNGNITREQMAAILYRYAQKKGFDTSKRGDLSKFPDAGKVSDWAKEPIAWAVAEGIIGGSDGKLLPQGNATRAQVATILMRFIEKFAES